MDNLVSLLKESYRKDPNNAPPLLFLGKTRLMTSFGLSIASLQLVDRVANERILQTCDFHGDVVLLNF